MTAPSPSYRHSAAVRRILRRIAQVVCPPDAAELNLLDAIVDHCEQMIGVMSAQVRVALTTGIQAYDLGAVAYPASLGRRASVLPTREHERYFARWWNSPLSMQREFANGVKGLLCIAYYEMPAVKARLGYTPDAWIEQVSRRRLATYSADIDQAERAITTPDPLPGVPVIVRKERRH